MNVSVVVRRLVNSSLASPRASLGPHSIMCSGQEVDVICVANIYIIGSCSPTPRVLPDFQASEERQPLVRWIQVRQLCSGQDRPRVPYRGAEDCEEGAEGAEREEEINDNHFVTLSFI